MDELLPWQRPQWELLMQRKAINRLPHALLCAGPAGLGKRIFAERLAQALLCATPTPKGHPCGRCSTCRLVVAGSHPDYRQIEPAEEGRAILVEAIRELGAFLGYTSQFRGYKIGLLAPAERMNSNAANSLLKTLEEPPAFSLLLLVTAAPRKLPATVRSRCQTVYFHLPALQEAVAWLAPQVGGTDPELLLKLSGGAPLSALAFSEEGRLRRRRELFRGYCQVISGKIDPVRAAEDWLKGDVAENLRWLVDWHMDMIRLKMVDVPPRLLNPDLQAVLQRLAGKLSLQTLFRRLDAVIRLHALYTTQVNAQIMIEAFLVDCACE